MTLLDVDVSLAASLGRSSGLLERCDLEAGAPAGPRWLACDELAEGPELDRWLSAIAARWSAPPQTAASYLLGFYTTGVASAAVACWLLERRVPDLDPANVSLRRARGNWVDGCALHGPRMAVLPADPAAGLPDVEVADGVDALRGRLAGELLAHLTPLVETVGARAKLGSRVRWGLVADALSLVFLEVGGRLGDQAAAAAEADAVLDQACTFRARPAWVPVGRHVFLRRAACCLAFTVSGGRYCTSCPAVDDDTRLRRLRDHVAAIERRTGGA